jgi:hypothetical protein
MSGEKVIVDTSHNKLRKHKDGQHVERIKAEDWAFPASFVAPALDFFLAVSSRPQSGGDHEAGAH